MGLQQAVEVLGARTVLPGDSIMLSGLLVVLPVSYSNNAQRRVAHLPLWRVFRDSPVF
jgi:hypothetical protein